MKKKKTAVPEKKKTAAPRAARSAHAAADLGGLRTYISVFAAASLAFLVLMALEQGGLLRTVIKAVPVTTLLVLVLAELKGFARICLAGALITSGLGDVLLDLPSPGLFIFGLLAFLTAHLFYCVLFFREAKKPAARDGWIIAGLVCFAFLMMWLFSGIDPGLYGPVVLYILVIISMSIGALLVPAANLLLFWGALLFIASDVVLAVNKFLVAIPYGRVINITLYFTAQLVIILAARKIWKDRA